jgi:serine/threonine-protein kinase
MSETGTTLQLGAVIASQFKVEKKLGQGGMGSVFLAEQLDMGRKVVVKVLNPELTVGNQVAVERFRREAQAVARLNHPNIVQIYVFGHTDDGQLYIAMEFVDGRDLGHFIEQGPMAQPRALRIMDQVCAALIEAHSTGIVHRDLKPENIMLTNRHGNADYVKVLDFGIAKLHDSGNQPSLTQAGTVFGTPRYMAPEQARGQNVDARTDIYALGLILHEMLVGHHPFKANTALDYLLQHVNEPVSKLVEIHPELQIAPRIDTIVMRCLEKDPEDRYQSVAELQRELRLALRDFSESSRGYPSAPAEVVAPAGKGKAAASPTKTASAVGVPARGAMPLWAWIAVGVGLAGIAVAVVLVLVRKKEGPPGADPIAVIGNNKPVGDSPEPPNDPNIPPDMAKQLNDAKAILAANPKLAALASAAMKGEAGEAEAARIMGTLNQAELLQLQKLGDLGEGFDEAAEAKLEALVKEVGALEGVVEALDSGVPPTTGGGVPPSSLRPGTPIDGFPVPEGARKSASTPQAELYEIQANPREVMAFYRHQLAGRYIVEDMPNGLQVKSQDSPFSFITLSANGDTFFLSLSRNVMAPETQKASRPAEGGETVFGVEIPPDSSIIMRAEMNVVLRNRKSMNELCKWFTDRYGRLEKIMVMHDPEAATPSCVLANSGGPHAWQAIAIVNDPQVQGALMISISKAF